MAKRTGVLLIHGFTGSPAEMSWLAGELLARDFVIRLPRLCGHARHPEDLLQCTYRDWIGDVVNQYEALSAHVDRLYVIGLSMGGALALYLAARYDFDGVVALSAPYRLSPVKEWEAKWLHFAIPWLVKKDGPDIRDQEAKSRLNSYYRYPTRAAIQLFELLKLVRMEIPRIRMPALIMHSYLDHVVPPENARQIYQHLASKHKKLIWLRQSYHIITMDVEKEKVLAEILTFIHEKPTDV